MIIPVNTLYVKLVNHQNPKFGPRRSSQNTQNQCLPITRDTSLQDYHASIASYTTLEMSHTRNKFLIWPSCVFVFHSCEGSALLPANFTSAVCDCEHDCCPRDKGHVKSALIQSLHGLIYHSSFSCQSSASKVFVAHSC
jgi:hypothetical protein